MGKCSRCAYSTWVNMGEEGEYLRACAYILRRGRRRPCPGGEACMVFVDRAALPARAERADGYREVG